MSGKPAATVGSMHVCPMCSGTIPHVGGPVTGPGSPNVLINGKPAAVVGDMCTCAGAPDTIVQGNPSVLINGKPIACVGDMTAHGGTITIGEPTVIIGSSTPSTTKIKPIEKIPFPKIKIFDHLGAIAKGKSKDLQQAKENISELENEAKEQDKKVTDVYWKDEQGDKIIDIHQYGGKATLYAKTQNMEGESLSITISDKDDNDLDSEVKEHSYTGTVGSDGIALLTEVEIKKDWEQTENPNTNKQA